MINDHIQLLCVIKMNQLKIMDGDDWKLIIAAGAFILSVVSLILSRRAESKARKASNINHLLGDKETVAHAALKMYRNGLPKSSEDREKTIDALIQTCIFEGSDRARALLYIVIEDNMEKFGTDMERVLSEIENRFENLDEIYQFDAKELDLDRARRRINTVRKIFEKRSTTKPKLH